MPSLTYLPAIATARFVQQFVFRHPERGPSCCVTVTDCQPSATIGYAHACYVFLGGDFLTGAPASAIAAEVNRGPSAGETGSHFLCVYPGDGSHHNLGANHDWADLERFTTKALDLIVEQYHLAERPRPMTAPTMMVQRFRVPRSHTAGKGPDEAQPADSNSSSSPAVRLAEPKKWWQFWK